MTTTQVLLRKVALVGLAAAFVVSVIPALVLASDAVPAGAVDVGAPAPASGPGSFNPVPDPSIVVEGGAGAGSTNVVPLAWAGVLLAILGAVAWGVYRYSADALS